MENGLALAEHHKGSNDDAEVQKLKDLVKKLEKQNEHLRTRTGKLNSNTNKLPRTIKGVDTNACGDTIYNPKTSDCHDDLSELDDSEAAGGGWDAEEASWLYSSPSVKSGSWSSKKSSDVTLSPHDWLADELEHPSTPQLATAKRNIMYKLDGSFDRSSPDIGYLQKSIEKNLTIVDDYKLEEPQDEQVVSRLHPEELQKDHSINQTNERSYEEGRSRELRKTSTASSNSSRSPAAHVPRRASLEEVEWNSSSSGSPHHIHHLPLPSQTMTTAHGLQPIGSMTDDDASLTRRSQTPTRLEGRHSRHVERAPSPRAKSPASRNAGKAQVRRSLPNPSRSRVSSGRSSASPISNSLPGELSAKNSNESPPSVSPHRPVIKSALTAPPSRLSKLTTRSGVPSASTTGGRSIPSARSKSPKPMQPRRTLPRPSQTSASSFRYMPTPKSSTPVRSSSPSPNSNFVVDDMPPDTSAGDIWGEDDVY